MRVLSAGLGTQSSALALMSAAGQLPRLDHVVFADTGGELPETYAWMEYLRARVEAAGIGFHVVSAGNLRDDLMSATLTSGNPTPPVHVLNDDGTKGRIGQYRCSYDYKRRVVTSAVRRLAGPRGTWKRTEIEQWIGYSVDEIGRVKPCTDCRCGRARVHVSHRNGTCEFVPWLQMAWPLIDLRMRRDDTIRWFTDNGHPTPPRSACYFCPNSGNARWSELRTNHPDLFEKACTLDEHIRSDAGFNRRGNVQFRGRIFLHPSLVPLRDADLRSSAQIVAATGQGALFDSDALAMDCAAGTCFT